MSDPSSEPSPDRADGSLEVMAHAEVEAGRTEVVDAGLGDAEQIGAELAAVDRALARIEAGDYGNCAECGSRLDDSQLAVDPTATTCPDHLGLEHAPEPAVDPGSAPGTPGPLDG